MARLCKVAPLKLTHKKNPLGSGKTTGNAKHRSPLQNDTAAYILQILLIFSNRTYMLNTDELCAGGTYQHIKSGKIYTLLMVTNQYSERAGFPPTAVYHDEDGHLWSRPLDEFKAKFNKH